MIKMNDNYKMRYAAYTQIIMLFVLMIVLCIGIKFLSKYVTIIPDAIYILCYIIIIIVCLVVIFIKYLSLSSRDPSDYNMIMMSPPINVGAPPPGSVSASGVSSMYTSAFGSYYGCIGQNCCAKGLSWSPVTGCSLTPAGTPSS